uniref:calpain-7-like isoform X2 n=1 Tax=Myxine glutinosa TaxID=7769 RepID=UPI00358EEBE0
MDAEALEQDAIRFAQLAVQQDQVGTYGPAAFYYTEAAQALFYAMVAGSQNDILQQKAYEYLNRAELLQAAEKQEKGNSIARQQFSKQPQELKQARFLLDQAFVEDEQGDQDDAVELYMEVANLCLKTSKTTSDKELQTKLNTLTKQAVERVEKLKGISPTATATPEKEDKQQRAARPAPRIPPLGMNFFGNNSDKATESQSRNILPSSSSGEHYSREEIQVLRRTSLINGLEYMPFIMADLKERFIFPVPFGDSHGKLALAPKQKERFSCWLRPSDMFDDPTMIYAISSFSIKQTVVSDCSFVASLAISAAYERRFKKKLITRSPYADSPRNSRSMFLYVNAPVCL